jgi:hypothetical protein
MNRNCWCCCAHLQVLAQLAAAKAPVTRLVLQHTPVTDEAVDLAVGAFPGLQSLYLSYCRSISDAALQSLMAAKKLQVLDLYNVPLVSDAGMSRLVRWVDVPCIHGVSCTCTAALHCLCASTSWVPLPAAFVPYTAQHHAAHWVVRWR